MLLRSLLAATALLAAACFVDNQPIDASAGASSTSPTTRGATSLPASTGEPTSSGTAEPGTTTTTTPGTTDPSAGPATATADPTTDPTTDPATDPATDPTTTPATDPTTATATAGPEPCSSLPQLGGALSLPACAACVQASCCEPFDTCAGSDACTTAWSCISAEPCQNDWLQCPGVNEAIVPLKAISDCTLGPCADVCLVACVPQTSACTNDPACSALESCLTLCAGSCAPGDHKCLVTCNDECLAQHPDGVDLWQAKTSCLGTVCAP